MTAYETKVLFGTSATAATQVTALAGQGYILTALGSDTQDNLIFVGTRVQGDSMARPLLIASGGASQLALQTGGYAVVGVVQNVNPTTYAYTVYDYIGER